MASILPLTILFFQTLGAGCIAELILQLTPIDSGNTLGDEQESHLLMVKCGGVAFPETGSKSVLVSFMTNQPL